MKRLLVWFVALLVALLTPGLAVVAAEALPVQTTAEAHAYDGHHTGAHLDSSGSERGPPSTHDYVTTCHAADRKPRCLSAREAGPTSHAAITHDTYAVVARGTRVLAPSTESAGVARGNPVVLARAAVAAEAGTSGGSGLARDALGRFTSGAGGESAATAAGRTAHASYENTLGGGDYIFNRALPGGSRLRPDAVTYAERIVRELKPDNPGAISDGWRQVNAYKAYLEELTGESWTAYVDLYTP